MTIKEYLSQAFYLERKIKSKENQLEYLRVHVVYATPTITDMPKCTSSEKSKMENTLIKIIELESYINQEILKLIILKKDIEHSIKNVNNIACETILEMRYLEYLSWQDVALKLNVSQDHVYYLHRKALELIKVP
jgi:DNA-directed RNA polymerase specialized sigma subunit